MLFCVPFIRKWTPAETDPKVGSQGVENDSVCGWNVKAVQVGLSEHDPMKRRRADYYVKYKYEVDGKSYYHYMITEFKNWKNEITVWYNKNHPKRHVTSEYSESKRIYYGWVFTIVLTLAAFLSGFSS